MYPVLIPLLLGCVLVGCGGGGEAKVSPQALLPSSNVLTSAASAASATPLISPTNSTAENGAGAEAVSSGSLPSGTNALPMVRVRVAGVGELPAPVREVVRLAQTTLGENILLSFVETITEPYQLSADQVIYLSDLGLSGKVVQSLLAHGAVLKQRQEAKESTPTVASESPGDAEPESPVAEATAGQAGALAAASGGTPNPEGARIPTPPLPATGAVSVAANGSGVPPASPPTVVSETPTTVINYNTFYETLSPYGAWVDVPEYGYCWRPTVAVIDTSWQPYCHNGSWVWCDQGWYWNSGYSWGWAPFHYGRWHRSPRSGWVWQPGCDWGPAWVNWRYTDGHCAWAPLPPECHWSAGVGFAWRHGGNRVQVGFGLHDACWVGIGWSDFCRPNLHAHRVPRERVSEIVSHGHSAVVGHHSQVVNIRGNHNTVVINNGAPIEKVRGATREEIRKVSITDVARPGETVLTGGGQAATRPTVPAFRPHFDSASRQPTPPPATVLHRQRDEELKTAAAPGQLANRSNPGRGDTSGDLGTVVPGRGEIRSGSEVRETGSSGRFAGDSGFVSARPGGWARPSPVEASRGGGRSSTPSTLPSPSPSRPNAGGRDWASGSRSGASEPRESLGRPSAVSPWSATAGAAPRAVGSPISSGAAGSTPPVSASGSPGGVPSARPEWRKPTSGNGGTYSVPRISENRSVAPNLAPSRPNPVSSPNSGSGIGPGAGESSGRPAYSMVERQPRPGSASRSPSYSPGGAGSRDSAPSVNAPSVPGRNFVNPAPSAASAPNYSSVPSAPSPRTYSGPVHVPSSPAASAPQASRPAPASNPSFGNASARSFSPSPVVSPSPSPSPSRSPSPVSTPSAPSPASSGNQNKNGRER